jgi:hypothetical protein
MAPMLPKGTNWCSDGVQITSSASLFGTSHELWVRKTA